MKTTERLRRLANDAEHWGHSDAPFLHEVANELATLEKERAAFLQALAEADLAPAERLRRLRLAIVPREVKRAECADCGEKGDFSGCPFCGKVVCQLCAEREGESCCEGEHD